MKLLIQKDLYFRVPLPADLSDEQVEAEEEYYNSLRDVAKRYSLSLRMSCTYGGHVEFAIPAQKVTLDEVAMNHFFHDFLTELFDIEVEYAPLGGEGCDFVLELVKAEQVQHTTG